MRFDLRKFCLVVNAEVLIPVSRRTPCKPGQRGLGNGVRTSVELNRREKLRDGIWALIDGDSNGKPKLDDYRDGIGMTP